ncbi:MAG: Flp family type IVb pilin [Acidobacteriaceae bacterium]|nr:Flp family type IVb pilin [Acidobacteriaceae bacterium]
MHTLRLKSQQLLADESGQDLIEYALIAALVGLAAVATLKSLATTIQNVFSAIQTKLDSAIS